MSTQAACARGTSRDRACHHARCLGHSGFRSRRWHIWGACVRARLLPQPLQLAPGVRQRGLRGARRARFDLRLRRGARGRDACALRAPPLGRERLLQLRDGPVLGRQSGLPVRPRVLRPLLLARMQRRVSATRHPASFTSSAAGTPLRCWRCKGSAHKDPVAHRQASVLLAELQQLRFLLVER